MNERRLREEYNEYVNSHAGEAYRCDSYSEWKFNRIR